MNITELSQKYNIAESTISGQFNRTQEKIMKKYNIKILKEGRGKNANYIEVPCYEKDNRAITMIKEPKQEILMNEESLALGNWEFICFLAIVTTPSLVFRGSYEDFLKYVEINMTDNNIIELKRALGRLSAVQYISYTIDVTNNNYFVASLTWAAERKMNAGISMVKTCQELAKKHNKRSWIPLLKTWLGIEVLMPHQPFTMKELANITNLNMSQIKDSHKILKESQIYKASRAYQGYQTCVGTMVDLNHPAFYKALEE